MHTELCHWLVLVAKKRDKTAFSNLFQFFAPRIKRFGLKQYGNDAYANDLVQDTMTHVWYKAHLYDEKKGSAATWIYTVMRNASFDFLRRQKNKEVQNLADDIWPVEPAASNEPSHAWIFSDHLMSKQLEKVVDSLPLTQKSVVKGVYFQEISLEQLSRQLGVPLGTIKSRLRLALEKIRCQIEESGND
ncbi:MAG: ECF RNA polymerase sigma factor RpoE [Candidatus Celerinatantimonas neptuna]|nr:MAG: ECF RNA polymerase sigma factor RpoE [Candidatus Celerinatantimonas neptuna]